DKFGGKVLRILNVRKSPFYVNGYNEEPVWIQGRDVGAECSGSFDEIYIDDTEIENELAGNGRRIAFGGLYNVTIGLLKTNTVITPPSIVGNAYLVDARNGAKVNITHYRLKAKTREAGYTFPMGPFRADASSTIRVGYFKNE
ncbi:hypothetical protein M0L63_RS21905, partial [Providencia rettgeri]|nr:hypothetical protein [Providencia rettgeri]